ncbi:MAG: Rv1535 family protein [Mycobacterium sp.]
MTVALYDEVVTAAPARKLTVVRDVTPIQGPAPTKTTRQRDLPIFGVGGDPLVNGAARLLAIPVRHVYAALWRVGVLEVQA